uniref:Uncharacterized protein n=1 Tax=Rhizophora mucronata TaxID=61149 RepID=A0A2P2QAB9_RHIMU
MWLKAWLFLSVSSTKWLSIICTEQRNSTHSVRRFDLLLRWQKDLSQQTK